MRVKKFNQFNFFIIALYFLELIMKSGLVKHILVFCQNKTFFEFLDNNEDDFAKSRVLIAANYDNQ